MRTYFSVLVLGFLVSACAAGNTYRYDLGDAALEVESENTVAVTTMDIRPYVRSGEKDPDFVGLFRAGFGNPFDVTTDSGRPLADDVTLSIVKALQANNVSTQAVNTPPGSGVEAVREALLGADADRFAMFVIRDWKSDKYHNSGLAYDVTLNILAQDGSVLAGKNVKGHDNLGPGLLPADARVSTEQAFRKKLEEAFGDPSIKAALQ